ALTSFILELLTSVILYIVPQGRVAYWADWRLWGMTKTQWTDLHINLGILFLLAIFLHIYYNWKPIVAYLKNRTRQFRLFTKEFNLAMILCLVFSFGTFYEFPPFSTIIDIGNSIKDHAAQTYGEPPYGHAELSTLKVFVKKVEFDLEESITKLNDAGIKVDSPDQTLKEIAAYNNVTPQKVHQIMKPSLDQTSRITLPDEAPGGFGRRTIADICHEYELSIKIVLRIFADNGLEAEAEMTTKEIAEKYDRNPHDLYDFFKQAAQMGS
ncbi:DUF4405 domain-containing protein, partial [Thermodesulfobacteriota bacterium]